MWPHRLTPEAFAPLTVTTGLLASGDSSTFSVTMRLASSILITAPEAGHKIPSNAYCRCWVHVAPRYGCMNRHAPPEVGVGSDPAGSYDLPTTGPEASNISGPGCARKRERHAAWSVNPSWTDDAGAEIHLGPRQLPDRPRPPATPVGEVEHISPLLARIRGRDPATHAVRQRVRCLLQTHVAADSRTLLRRTANGT
jgi:hypothetical protein